jgi:hypothetical protein
MFTGIFIMAILLAGFVVLLRQAGFSPASAFADAA